MKRFIFTAVAASLIFPSIWAYAATKNTQSSERFYGKVTSISHENHVIEVHNKRKKETAKFNWTKETSFVLKKNSVSANDVSIGQSVIVYYHSSDQEVPVTHRITLRSKPKPKKDDKI